MGNSLGGAEPGNCTAGGTGSSPVSPTIKKKLRKELSKLDRYIFGLKNKLKIQDDLRKAFGYSKSNIQQKLEKTLQKLDSKRFWIRLQLKGYQ